MIKPFDPVCVKKKIREKKRERRMLLPSHGVVDISHAQESMAWNSLFKCIKI